MANMAEVLELMVPVRRRVLGYCLGCNWQTVAYTQLEAAAALAEHAGSCTRPGRMAPPRVPAGRA